MSCPRWDERGSGTVYALGIIAVLLAAAVGIASLIQARLLRKNCGARLGILPVRTLSEIGIGAAIFVSDRERYWFLDYLAFCVFRIYMEG